MGQLYEECEHHLDIRAKAAAALESLAAQLAERDAELAALKAKNESLERAHASIMQAVDECGSYKP